MDVARMLADSKTHDAYSTDPSRTTVARWVDVCSLEDLTPGIGVAALIDGEQIAIVRPTVEARVYALSNFDPFSKAFVISRGIVGDRNGVLKIASPVFKQNFSLETGQCLDDDSVRLPTYETRIVENRVHVKVYRLAEEP